MRQKMSDMVHRIQDEICNALKEIDGVDFRQDEWTRKKAVEVEVVYFLVEKFSRKQESMLVLSTEH